MKSQYDDIINLPHHVSKTHPQMPMSDRAAQFSPFAALTGYDAAIRETGRLTDAQTELSEEDADILNEKIAVLVERISEKPHFTVTYFVPDDRKKGGAYSTISGNLRRIDEYERLLIFVDGKIIQMDTIADIECDLFRESTQYGLYE